MPSSQKPPPTISLLVKYYSSVKPLRTYLCEILSLQQDGVNSTHAFLPVETDSAAYHNLVNTAFVASSAPEGEDSRRFTAFPVMADMREIIDQAQERLFKLKRSQNIITAGYRLASKEGDRGKKGMTRCGITNFFINTMITALQSLEWDTLLHRIGEDAMLQLLAETSIFVTLPNGCLCQMTGEPIVYLRPALKTRDVEKKKLVTEENNTSCQKRPLPHAFCGATNRPVKRRKPNDTGFCSKLPLDAGANTKAIGVISPGDISLPRSKVFYGRPALAPNTSYIVIGLPPRHELNQLEPLEPHNPKPNPAVYAAPDPRKEAANARHISKYIFPRQYGLSNPFKSSPPNATAIKYPYSKDREMEIKLAGPCKTPKRLKEVLSLVDKLIWRHKKCGYKPLLQTSCPSKLESSGARNLDSSIILELMSEQSIAPWSQASLAVSNVSVNSSGNPVAPCGLTQAREHAKNKPRFVEFSCSYVEVYRYVALVTKTVIPKSFWGSKENLKVILRHVKTLISSRRYETLTLHHILQGFSISACDWLMPPGEAVKKQTRISVSDSLKRREILEEFLYWYFDSFVLSLLKTSFYITESSAFRNQVLYFRQDDWASLCAPLIERLTSGTFERMTQSEVVEVLRQRKLGFSFVRLLPKETGVRPIVNLRRKKPMGPFSEEKSINQVLQAAFQILTYERKTQPRLLGASVFSPDDVYVKLKQFKSRLLRDFDGNMPKLYFVKVDVQACFDTIEQTKLLEILRELISEDTYMLQRYGQVSESAGKIKRVYVKNALPESEHPHFLQQAAELAGVIRNAIFVDQVRYPYSQKMEVLELLEEHITENIVKIGQHYYRQTVGIPQGSVLSTVLCSFFYGDLEKRFMKFSDDPGNVLLRLIDDYLFITTCLPTARSFLDMMNKGHPEYGCFISKDKTLTNFDYDAEVTNVVAPPNQHFLWCGYAIDMKNLSVSVDYSRYNTSGLRSTLTVERGRRPGAAFNYKMLQLGKARSHIIYSDAGLNTEKVIYANIYQNFLLTAMKMNCYLRDWGIRFKKSSGFIHNTVRNTITYCHSSLHAQARRASARSNGALCKVEKWAVIWLGNHAFHTVLGQKPGHHASLVTALAFELSRPRYRRYRARFRTLVKECQIGLSHIVR